MDNPEDEPGEDIDTPPVVIRDTCEDNQLLAGCPGAEDPDEIDDEKLQTAEHPAAKEAEEDCMELTAPFSRELVKKLEVEAIEATDRESDRTLQKLDAKLDDAKALIEEIDAHVTPEPEPGDVVVKQSVVQQIVAKSLAPADRESAPVTVAAPRTVRGFPPPPPIPISSRRGILPRRF